MNDERYIHFTERIQNMLIKPEILALMGDETGASAADGSKTLMAQEKELIDQSNQIGLLKYQTDREKKQLLKKQ